MYAKYVSTTTSVGAQVINDLALLLSGSPISALSASCDKINSTLVSTVAPGWTLLDSAAPASGCMLSAPDIDGLTTKFVYLYPAVSELRIGSYETWNAVAHTGTNATPGISICAHSATVANTYIVFATPRSFYICPVNGAGSGAFEFTRECEYLKGTTYPCFAIVPSYISLNLNSLSPVLLGGSGQVWAFTPAGVPRMKNLYGAGDITGATSGVFLATLGQRVSQVQGANTTGTWSSTVLLGPVSRLFDASGTPYYELRPLWAMSDANAIPDGTYYGKIRSGAIVGKFYDIWETSTGAGNNLDTFSDGTSTYVYLTIGASAFAFKMA